MTRSLSLLGNSHIADSFIKDLAAQVEIFLDNPDWRGPYDQDRELYWQCLYLFALLPASQRMNYASIPLTEEVASHLQTVLDEYERSKEMLIEGTLRYAIRIARHYSRSGVPYLDLVQEGVLGLIQSIDKFQEIVGAHFQSYAANWIMQRITRYIADHSRLIRVPVHQHDKVSAIGRKRRELVERLDREPSDNELFAALQWLSSDEILIVQQYEAQMRYERLLDRLRKFTEWSQLPLSQIPNMIRQQVLEYDKAYDSLRNKYGQPPNALSLFQELGWLSVAEVTHLRQMGDQRIGAQKLRSVSLKLRKARIQMRYCRIANAQHHSLERTYLHREGSTESIGEYLVAPVCTEEEGEHLLLSDAIQEILACLTLRERLVIERRFGLAGSPEMTLQDIGRELGVTRERVRQIEAKALRTLRKPNRKPPLAGFTEADPSRVQSIADSRKLELLRTLHQRGNQDDTEQQVLIPEEEARIDTLIDRWILRGHHRISSRRPFGTRVQMLQKVLEEAGQPLHYTDIHERVMQSLPPECYFPKERTYASLFYNDSFELLSNGMFGLTSWNTVIANIAGEQVLRHCPRPLHPDGAEPRAFFESIMVGRELLKRTAPMSAGQFYTEMLAWAGKTEYYWPAAQSAFDAWYAAGLLQWVDIVRAADTELQLTIGTNATLNEVRFHCLNSLCQRILRMPELLFSLTRIARPGVSEIQRLLFGSEHAGFDVPLRLSLLSAFEAVQHIRDEWRLTPVGFAILEANRPQELPDLSEAGQSNVDEGTEDQIDWEFDDLGLLEI